MATTTTTTGTTITATTTRTSKITKARDVIIRTEEISIVESTRPTIINQIVCITRIRTNTCQMMNKRNKSLGQITVPMKLHTNKKKSLDKKSNMKRLHKSFKRRRR